MNLQDCLEWLNLSTYRLSMMLLRVSINLNQELEVISIVKYIHGGLGFETLTNESNELMQ